MELMFNIYIFFFLISVGTSFPFVNRTFISPENATDDDVSSTFIYDTNEFHPVFLYLFVGLLVALAFICAMSARIFLRRRQPIIKVDKEEEEKLALITNKYKPVVCIHGLFDPKSSCDILEAVIRVYHPGTEVKVIDLYYGCKSLANLWEQIEAFRVEVEKISAEHPEGIHLIGLSQGNIVARGVLETSDKHNVDTYISICGPHMGQYGLSIFNFIPGFSWLKKSLYKYFYTAKGQNYSVAEFWKDPHQIDFYKRENKFLPLLNNEISHSRSEEFKKNFTQLKRLVLVGGPNDGCITPWESSHFAFFDEHENVVPMQEQEIYKEDTLGLKTLDERKAITLISVPHVFHQFFSLDVCFMKEHVLPYLT